ncbi:MAG: NAD-glutamate dehydrogenase, partial [Candidatus Competibacterales bacterium]|nr:NAD-glutamate dehydrogenase [Candidatus Competibacterales bacterium]
GGGIYSRSAKSIELSAQARQALGIEETRLTPNELINRLLKAPVDLLWNGGIGTYVKAKSESHADAGDKSNDAIRINGSELRCKVVGEGGNLGLTQLGRIEYALKGGKVLTDAIDNSGGVNCSDHEVNIKILLDQVVRSGDMTVKQRNQLLADMTDEVASLVLRQNYLQPEAISVTHSVGPELLGDHTRVIRSLERSGRLDRALEFLPSDEQLGERESAGLGLTPPEMAVLLAYSKITLFEALIGSDVPEDPFLQQELFNYFPTPLRERYSELMHAHPLRREIIATYITNSVINRMGSAYVIRLQEDSGEIAPNIARAYSAAREIYSARQLWSDIDDLDNVITADLQIRMHLESRALLERASQWLLRNRRPPIDIEAVVEQLQGGVQELAAALPDLMRPAQQEEFRRACAGYTEQGVPEELARSVVSLPVLYSALDITDVAGQSALPVTDVARIYFSLAERLNMTWLHDSIVNLPVTTHWQRRARAALLSGLYDQGRALTADVLRSTETGDVEQRLNRWLERNRALVERCLSMFEDLQSSGQQPDLAMLSVALRETGNLAQAA